MGGMMTTPKGSPMPQNPLIDSMRKTPDLDAAVERAKKRGATVMNWTNGRARGGAADRAT